jgi:uncharacterized repeat protein (TIGR01451 family)
MTVSSSTTTLQVGDPITYSLAVTNNGPNDAMLRVATFGDVDAWDRDWRPVLVERDRPDGKWPWRDHVVRSTNSDGWLALALTTEYGLDGLMALRVARSESRLMTGADIIYVEHVGAAPWHQPLPVGERLVRGIGALLVITAIKISSEIGCDGRVGLHAKPDVEGFYHKQDFEALAMEQTDDGVWRYFEIGTKAAKLRLEAPG